MQDQSLFDRRLHQGGLLALHHGPRKKQRPLQTVKESCLLVHALFIYDAGDVIYLHLHFAQIVILWYPINCSANVGDQ